MSQSSDNQESDSYLTVKKFHQTEIKIKGSRFIGYVRPVHNRAEAETFITEISTQHYDATHNCYAYRVGLGSQSIFRYNDDGEPSGTAGKPILQAIEGRNLTNTVIVVTRYFGGTKLGTGGLARAYGECAQQTLQGAGHVQKFLVTRLEIDFEYHVQNAVMKVVNEMDGTIISSDYTDRARILLAIRQSKADECSARLVQATADKITIKKA